MNIPNEITCKILWHMMRENESDLPADLQLSVQAIVTGALSEDKDPYTAVTDMLQERIEKLEQYQLAVDQAGDNADKEHKQ
ncbi:MAG: hypothetical protein KAJ73_02310 [Zetaproteobacteria bacterium]|nr:hypothetical protein [Zetaproteobacteria bacterium]